jgi:hypothetical protein
LPIPLQRRLPSVREAARTYLAGLVPIVAWSVFSMLDEGLPSWSRQMRAWDVIGVIAYVQAFALLESMVVFLPALCLSILLPGSWFRDKFVALGTGLVYLSAGWAVFAQIHENAVRTWGYRQLLPWVATYLASLLLFAILIHRSSRLEALITSFADRVTPLASTYLFVAVTAVMIVLLRNL